MAEIRKKPYDMDIFSTLLPSLMSFHVKIYSKLRAMVNEKNEELQNFQLSSDFRTFGLDMNQYTKYVQI